eukprot:m.185370 g.185370  ORF g.185370 m.185370 type:complete len:419 (-) comp16430_c0_seq1:140-1396(-)
MVYGRALSRVARRILHSPITTSCVGRPPCLPSTNLLTRTVPVPPPTGMRQTLARGMSTSAATPGLWGAGTKTVTAVDCHAGGEPARVIVAGAPDVPGTTMMEKRTAMMQDYDEFRQLLLHEPRGYPCQNANVIYPSVAEGCDFGYVILEQNKVYPAMSGHNTICVATALLETGMVPMQEPVTEFSIEAPAGPIHITAECSGGRVLSVKLLNVPAFVAHLDVEVDVPEIGKVTADIAYGGMWYTIVNAASIGLDLVPNNGKAICRAGEMIKVASREQVPVEHPEIFYPGPDILCFRGPPPPGSNADGMNAVVMSNVDLDWKRPETWTAMIDRSPCGTGTCAVMAVMHARGELSLRQPFVHESLIGSQFVGELVDMTTVAGIPAVVPTVSGRAWITQHCQIVVDPSDPYPAGYTVGDIWG